MTIYEIQDEIIFHKHKIIILIIRGGLTKKKSNSSESKPYKAIFINMNFSLMSRLRDNTLLKRKKSRFSSFCFLLQIKKRQL